MSSGKRKKGQGTSQQERKIDVERKENSSRVCALQARKHEMVKEVLARTNGAFTTQERKLFESYLFEDKSSEEVMRELSIPSDEFYRLVERTTQKMKEYIGNFVF